jgi:hypothetical protein
MCILTNFTDPEVDDHISFRYLIVAVDFFKIFFLFISILK